jgi:hypothetical protein
MTDALILSKMSSLMLEIRHQKTGNTPARKSLRQPYLSCRSFWAGAEMSSARPLPQEAASAVA